MRSVRYSLPFIKASVINDLANKSPYMYRWSIHLPFGHSIKLHKIVRPDEDRCEHDHPFAVWLIILWGGYTEMCYSKPYEVLPWLPWRPFRIYKRSITFRHRILTLHKSCSWSLGWYGPKRASWGFYTKHGWMFWKHFVTSAKSAGVAWCEDGTSVEIDNSEPMPTLEMPP